MWGRGMGGRGVGGMTGVAYIITGNEELKKQTALNRLCYFHFFGAFLAARGSHYSYSELIVSSWKRYTQ